MNVQELINMLSEVEDKTLEVCYDVDKNVVGEIISGIINREDGMLLLSDKIIEEE